MALLGAQSASVATFRCFYVGEAYAAAAQWREAQALYNLALERLTDALGHFEAVGGGVGGRGGWQKPQVMHEHHGQCWCGERGEHHGWTCADRGRK